MDEITITQAHIDALRAVALTHGEMNTAHLTDTERELARLLLIDLRAWRHYMLPAGRALLSAVDATIAGEITR